MLIYAVLVAIGWAGAGAVGGYIACPPSAPYYEKYDWLLMMPLGPLALILVLLEAGDR